MQQAVQNRNTAIQIRYNCLYIPVMKLPLTSCATKCYRTFLCYLPNCVHFKIITTLYMSSKILILSTVNLQH